MEERAPPLKNDLHLYVYIIQITNSVLNTKTGVGHLLTRNLPSFKTLPHLWFGVDLLHFVCFAISWIYFYPMTYEILF